MALFTQKLVKSKVVAVDSWQSFDGVGHSTSFETLCLKLAVLFQIFFELQVESLKDLDENVKISEYAGY